ncbi:hypothetical protein ACJ72_04356 [Emergomyces africanus]|uniref:Mucin n=1 Tax=Emergomyces africanus TaxID=1955775 RepID=A0A1B7NWZ5_9EURO|nr:hypothetical protein ACJ72_04356 [Emergomyces africanus]
MEYHLDDFYSLPPALRRKLFSNVERFRLEQLRLTQMVHNDGRNYRPHLAEDPPSSAVSNARPGILTPHTPRRPSERSLKTRPIPGKPGLKGQSRPFRRLRKPKSVQIAYLAAQADSVWFRSLPTKVQQQHFSREERTRLGGWRSSIIFDSADRALYKRGHQKTKSLESISSLLTSASFPDSDSMAPSARAIDSAIGLDNTLYDSFRWLDEEEEIDLRLDDYHSHIAETNKQISTDSSRSSRQRLHRRPTSLRRQPSFRRTLSFSSTTRGQHSTSSKIPSTSQSSTAPSSFTNTTTSTSHKRSFSRPKSSAPVLRHVPQGSLSSLDSPAQYYQDPEARLKLRVYLASPQKFDEAIEFGFPSLDNEDNIHPPRISLEPRTTLESTRTFLEDASPTGFPDIILEDGSITDISMGSPTFTSTNSQEPQSPTTSSTISPPPTKSQSRKFSVEKSTPPRFIQPIPLACVKHNTPGNREMTLKMTLTRPDLRTADSTGNLSPSLSDIGDSLRLAELPVVDENHAIWNSPPEDTGTMRKMWRKLWKRSG